MFSVGWHAVEMTTSANRWSTSVPPLGPASPQGRPPCTQHTEPGFMAGGQQGAPPRPWRGKGCPMGQRHAGAAVKLAVRTSHPPHLHHSCPPPGMGPDALWGRLCESTQGGHSRSRHELPPASGKSVRL